MSRLKARPARIAVVRQHAVRSADHPREQMHVWIATRLREVWDGHFENIYAVDSSGVELGMQAILYLTGSPHVSAERLASLLARTYPSVAQSLSANVRELGEALGNDPKVQ